MLRKRVFEGERPRRSFCFKLTGEGRLHEEDTALGFEPPLPSEGDRLICGREGGRTRPFCFKLTGEGGRGGGGTGSCFVPLVRRDRER